MGSFGSRRNTNSKDRKLKKKRRIKDRGMMFGDMSHNLFNATSTLVGGAFGLRAGGPVGAAAGASAGAAIAGGGAAYLKHTVASFVNSKSSGASVGSFASMGEAKSAIHAVADTVRTEADAQIQSGRGQLEEVLSLVQQATEGSSNSLVSDAIDAIQDALSRMDEALSSSAAAKSSAESWANGL
ncbi:hypothetical protein [Haloglycomyces albus]|uniref:hypothetical protein n=1 Tax=Haloglycomyces albus TaxID=526067 RepID=UPI0005528B27|nr:hypothetical protein [Haloglycomyces albus]